MTEREALLGAFDELLDEYHLASSDINEAGFWRDKLVDAYTAQLDAATALRATLSDPDIRTWLALLGPLAPVKR